jgi:hypothetical protein
MRRSRLLCGLVACAMLVAPAATAVAQSDAPAGEVFEGHGRPVRGGFSEADPVAPRPLDPRDIGKPWDPSLSTLERLDALIRRRAMSGDDKRDCRFGPIERRISYERLRFLFGKMQSLSGRESWELLMAEPEDPNAAPISVAIPGEDGPSCPDGDVTANLLAERRRLVAEAAAIRASNPVTVHRLGDLTPMERLTTIMLSRGRRRLYDHPDCYFGPVDLRIPPERRKALIKRFPHLSGEESWRLLMAAPQDPDAEPRTYIVRSGSGPSCPAGNIDERLRAEARRLRSR